MGCCMKFRNLQKRVATFGVVSALSVLCLSYQNCSRPSFNIDEAAKAKTLSETPVFGDNDRDPGYDPVKNPDRDPGIDPVTGMPRDPGKDPSKDPVTGLPRDPGIDPVTGMPRDPGKDPVTGLPRDPGTDPSTSKTFVNVEYICPLGVQNHGAYKAMVSTGELKAVVVKTMSFSLGAQPVVCEIQDVKAQMNAGRKIDITSCFDKAAKQTYIYIVEKSVTKDFKDYSITMSDAPFFAKSPLPLRIGYAEFDDAANAKGCDVKGDPLLVQLANDGKPQPISLTSAERGVMFDLLGKKNDYKQVQTAWLAESRSENYFLVLPDANGDVKGIDQLFGDNTLGPDPKRAFAKQGFEALAKHDENRDKVISDEDVVFSKLRLWKDENLDGVAQSTELFTLDQKGVVAIDIFIDRKDRRYEERDVHGNLVKYKSIVVMKDGQYGLVYDLWLRYIMK